jgi:hypothetical protein
MKMWIVGKGAFVRVGLVCPSNSKEIDHMNQNNRRMALARLVDPLLLLALALLLLNDLVWKAAFHNSITGKLSDFAGLYAFVWVGLCLLPRSKKWLPWMVAILFCWWKSTFSQFAIDAWNGLDLWRIDRVVDMWDCLALIVLPIAVWKFGRKQVQPWQVALPIAVPCLVATVSIFAFVGTSSIQEFPYKDTYSFNSSLQSVVYELNRIDAASGEWNPPLSIYHQNANEFREEKGIRFYLHHGKDVELHYDTTWANWADSVFIHDIRTYEVPVVDSIYLNPEGYFVWRFSNLDAGAPESVAECLSLESFLILEEKANKTKLSLKSIQFFNCRKMIDISNGKKPEDVVKAMFEKQVIQPLQATLSRQ